MPPTSSDSPGRRGIPWRRWNRAVHRDVGYLVVGLTVVYAVSGIAVNHIDSWNPNYSIERIPREFEAFDPGERDETIAELLARLELPPPVDAFRSTPARIELLFDGWSVEADVSAGAAVEVRPRERPILFDLNFLHLNHAKRAWTWVADVYAALLLTMAISGMFVLRGRKGLGGRGKWLVMVGVTVPVGFLLMLRWLP